MLYCSHSKSQPNYFENLYQPLINLYGENGIILPHYKTDETYPIFELMKNGKISAVIAEVPYPATGQGIELGWAYAFGIPVHCFYQSGVKMSGSIKYLFPNHYQYSKVEEMIENIAGLNP